MASDGEVSHEQEYEVHSTPRTEEYHEFDEGPQGSFAAKLWDLLKYLGYQKKPRYYGYKEHHLGHSVWRVEAIIFVPKPSDGSHRVEKVHPPFASGLPCTLVWMMQLFRP